MKPITSALVGAAIVGGSWIGLHAVAFAGEAAVAPSQSLLRTVPAALSSCRPARKPERARRMRTVMHRHGTCARCSAATAE